MNRAGPGNFCQAGNCSRGAVLNIEGRPSCLPNNSREPTVALIGMKGGAVSYEILKFAP